MRRGLVLIAFVVALIGPARAFDFAQLKPLDLTRVDPAILKDFYGAWEIRDKSGQRRCRIKFKKDFTIGGYEADVAPGCEKAFPVMADISAWRVSEGWVIDLVDPIRRIRVRFETPDNRYVAFGDRRDIAGIDTIMKVPDRTK